MLEVGDGIFEVHILNLHDEVNGVEISVAVKATGEVGFGIRRGIKGGAERAKESKSAVAFFSRKGRHCLDQPLNWDCIAQEVKFALRESLSRHVASSRRVAKVIRAGLIGLGLVLTSGLRIVSC